MTRIRGVISKIILTRGFGFIRGDDGHNYFLHVDKLESGQVWEECNAGTKVEFEPDSGGKSGNKLRALRVVKWF